MGKLSTRQLFSALCVIGCLLTCLAPGSRADTRSVAIIDLSADTRIHGQIRHEIVRAIRKNPETTVRDLDGILNGGGEVDAQARLRNAMSFLNSGIDALKKGDPDEAADQLESAAGLMEQDFALLADGKPYRRLLLRLGEAQLELGLKDVARKTLDRAAAFRARPKDVQGALSSAAEAQLNRAVANMADLSLGAVSVTTTPSHADVWVDGRYKGVTPKTVAGLTAGDHLLVVRKAGYGRITLPVKADPEELGMVSVVLEPARRKPVWDQMLTTLDEEVMGTGLDDPLAGPGVEQIGSILLADLGVIIRCGGQGERVEVELSLYDTRAQRLLNRVVETVDWSTRNRQAIMGLVNRLMSIDYVAALGGASGPVVGDDKLTRKWWFWTALAAGAATITTAIILSAGGEQAPPPETNGSLLIRF